MRSCLLDFTLLTLVLVESILSEDAVPPFIVKQPVDHIQVEINSLLQREERQSAELKLIKAKFECKANGSDPIIYTWQKSTIERRPYSIVPDNKTYFVNGGELVYVIHAKQNKEQFFCTATNKYGSAVSEKATVDRTLGSVEQNGNCWYITTNEGSLIIHESLYYCWTFSNRKEICSNRPYACGENSFAPFLTLKYPYAQVNLGNISQFRAFRSEQVKIIPVFTSTRDSIENIYFELHCRSSNRVIQFNKAGDGKRVHFDSQRKSLIFDPLVKSDEGEYFCEYEEPEIMEPERHYYNLEIEPNVKREVIYPMKLATDMLPLTFECDNIIDQEQSIKWIRNAQISQTYNNGDRLRLSTPQPGTYQCVEYDRYSFRQVLKTLPIYFEDYQESLNVKFLIGKSKIVLKTQNEDEENENYQFVISVDGQNLDESTIPMFRVINASSNAYWDILSFKKASPPSTFKSERDNITSEIKRVYQVISVRSNHINRDVIQNYLLQVYWGSFQMPLHLSIHFCSSECPDDEDNDHSERNHLQSEIAELLSTKITAENLERYNLKLDSMRSKFSLLNSNDLQMISAVTKSVSDVIHKEKDQKTLLQVYDSLLTVSESTFQKSEQDYNTAQIILNQLETFSQNASQNTLFKTEKFTLINYHLPSSNTSTHNKKITFSSSSGKVLIQTDSESQSGQEKDVQISVSLSSVMKSKISFYRMTNSALLFKVQNQEQNVEIMSSIIAAKTNLVAKSNDSNHYPVEVKFPLSNLGDNLKATDNLKCAYWLPLKKKWDTADCVTVRSNEDKMIRCKCSHLTNFALIMKVDCHSRVHPMDTKILSILSYLTLSVSAVGLVILIVIYSCLFYEKQVKNASSMHPMIAANSRSQYSTLISFSVTLLLGVVVFLAGGRNKSNSIQCTLTAIFLHYFFLSVFFWSTVECFRLFVSLIRIYFSQNRLNTFVPKFFLFSSLYGWGVPALIVGLTFVIDKDSYGYEACDSESSGLCFLKQKAFYLSFLIPQALTLILDVLIFSLIVYIIKQSKKSNPNKHSAQNLKRKLSNRVNSLFSIFGFSSILCLTWVLGLLQVSYVKALFQYLFVLCNGLQGFFLFLFFGVFKPDVRKYFIENIACLKRMEQKKKRKASNLQSTDASTSNRDDKTSPNWTVKTSLNDSGEQTAKIEKRFLK